MYVSSNQILVRLFERQGETFIRTNWKIKKRKPHFEYNIFFNLFDNRRDVDLICVLDVFLWWTPLSDESDKCAPIKRIQWKKQRMWKRRAAVGDFWIYSKEKQLRGYFKSMLLTLLLCLRSYDPSNIFACPQLLETYHMMMEYAPAKPVKNMQEINPFRRGGWNIVRKMNIWSRSEASRENMKFLGQSLSQGHYQPIYQQIRCCLFILLPIY